MSIEIGNTYSRLTVVSKAEDRISPTSGKARFYWVCKCSCDRNKTVEVRSDGLTSGKTRSCGCLRDEAASVARKNMKPRVQKPLKPLPNKNYGILEVIEQGESTLTPKGRKLHRWTCQCDCGNIKDILHEELVKGSVVSCGCLSRKYFQLGCLSANEEFIYKARELHGDLYSYENINYTHSQEFLSITCNKHGDFEQWPSNHLQGRGCPICASESRRLTAEEFLTKSREIHGNLYDYSLVDFKLRMDFVEILCPVHGKFSQKPSDHLCGRGCQQCGLARRFVGLESFIERSNEIHNFKFDYSEVVYEHSNTKVKIICKDHGPFMQQPSGHLMGQQCPKCSGERRALKQHWNYIKRCELDPMMAEGPGTLYLLEMNVNNENFLKVGISTDYKKRLGRYTEYDIDFKVLKLIETTALNSAVLESKVLKFVRNQELRYIPLHDFKGWTECATIESKELLINYYEELNV